MLVRNLQKRGDYQKSILAQDENLRLAIQNDQNVAEARKKAKLGIIPEQTRRQNRISEQILTDALEIKAVAMNNLRSIFSEEQSNKFLNGDGKTKPLTQDDMEYLNIFWEDLKPQLQNKTGLTLSFFRSIIQKAYAGRRANYGFYTGRTRGAKSLVINTPDELTTTFPRENVLTLAIDRLQKLALVDPAAKLALKEIALLKEYFPTAGDRFKMLPSLTPEKQQDYYKRFQDVFEGFEPNMEEWVRVLEMDDKAFAKEVRFLLPDMEGFKDKATQLYADLLAERKAANPVPVEPAVPVVPETVPVAEAEAPVAPVAPVDVIPRPKIKAKKPFIVPEIPKEPESRLVVFEPVKSPRSEAEDVISLLAGLLPESKVLKKRRESLKKADLAEIVASVDDDLQKDEEKLRVETEARQAKLAALTQVVTEDATGTAQANIKLLKAQKKAQKEIQRLEAAALEAEKEQERLLKVRETLTKINTLSQVVREEATDTALEQVNLIKAQKQAQQEDFDRAKAQLMLDKQRLNAAIDIQRGLRGMKAREELAKLLQEKQETEAYQRVLQAQRVLQLQQDQARIQADIVKIQAKTRGRIAKDKVAQELKLREEMAQVIAQLKTLETVIEERPPYPTLESGTVEPVEIVDDGLRERASILSKAATKAASKAKADDAIEKLRASRELKTQQLEATLAAAQAEEAQVSATLIQSNVRGRQAKALKKRLTELQSDIAKIKALPPVPPSLELPPYTLSPFVEPVELPFDKVEGPKKAIKAYIKQQNDIINSISKPSPVPSLEAFNPDLKASADFEPVELPLDTGLIERTRLEIKKQKFLVKEKQRNEEARQAIEKQQADIKATADAVAELALKQAKDKEQARVQFEIEKAAYERSQAKKRAEQERKDRQIEVAKTKLALLVQSKVRGKKAQELLEIEKQEAQKYLDKLLEGIVAEQSELAAKREIRQEGQRLASLEFEAFQERKERLINRLMTKWTDLGLVKSDPRLQQFTQDYAAGATKVSEFGVLPLTEQIIDEFILKAKREEDQLRQDLALVDRDKAEAKAKAKELARQEAVRTNPLSLSNFKTRLKKTKQLSAERQKEREETLAITKRLEQIQKEREALEAALDAAEQEAEVAALEAEVAEREAQQAEREAQIGKPATELEQRAAAETRGRKSTRPKPITKADRLAKEAREAKIAEQQTRLLKAEAEELRLQEEADETMRKIDAWRQQRILNNKEELKRLVASRKAKDAELTAAKAVVVKAKKSSPEANFAAAASYRLDEEIAADEKRMETLKEEIDDDEEEQQRREEEQQQRGEQIRAQLVKRAELRKVALQQANKEETVRRTRGISAEIRRRDERDRRLAAYSDQTLAALRGKQLQQQEKAQKLVDAKARKAEEQAAKAQRDAEKLASKAKADTKAESPSVLAFVAQKMSAFNPLKQARKGIKLKERVTFQQAEEQPATVFDVALATTEARAKAERERMRQKSQERRRSLSPATALRSKAEADADMESRRASQVSQVQPRGTLSYNEKRLAVTAIKNVLGEIERGKPYKDSVDKTLYSILTDPTRARNTFRKLALTPEEQFNFSIKESDVIPKVGKGITLPPKTWANLGKFLINETLLEQGALSVKTQNGSPVVGFGKKIAVSDNLQAILLDLIETKKLRGLSDLDNDERQMIETLLTKSGLAHGLGVKKIFKPDDDAEKVKRFGLVKGIYDAGNNSMEVKQELRSLIEYFVKTGRLDKRQGMDALTEL